ncbi:hypothetical protein, partial [Pseudomonas syringae group genomosp. 7]|uniref:hypothetical protein n=1 Tax=Pseudomonas syringae group genomosp. 7 TaxID=251699 RepID=UPI00376F6BF5
MEFVVGVRFGLAGVVVFVGWGGWVGVFIGLWWLGGCGWGLWGGGVGVWLGLGGVGVCGVLGFVGLGWGGWGVWVGVVGWCGGCGCVCGCGVLGFCGWGFFGVWFGCLVVFWFLFLGGGVLFLGLGFGVVLFVLVVLFG